ncbi:MAG: tRNA (guanosine(37)-N1)-methyltransferase TrmD [Pyramidobacter sp.]|nr:tRNA (guanosine(37)-N1)-methyltransferase TrmD [Pyramidobacter sp.]
MNVTVITAFPDFLDSFRSTSIVGRAIEKGLISVSVCNPRDFAEGNYRQIDDYSFGGNGGMTLMPEPLQRALDAVAKPGAKVLFPTPQGAVLTQDLVEALSKEEHIVIICGHYEGLDERFIEKRVHQEFSIGDYVLTGGELPAMVLIDALSRLVPGVVGNSHSVQDDSFYNGMLDTPHYTRPAVWEGQPVPAVLTSGDDRKIEHWRRRAAALRTLSRRPDLLSRANVMDYLEDEMYVGVVLPDDGSVSDDLRVLSRVSAAYGAARLIAAPSSPDGYEQLCARAQAENVKCVPTLSRMTEWASRKKHGRLLIVAAEAPDGIPWMEAKRRIVEAQGPVLILFGGCPSRGDVIRMRPQQSGGGELPRTALITAALDRFFGSR